ncbi:MAG: putative toxin-antitoxin system toxin component, PIN family [Deltaproteobacteria bacterium]|nr:putative toxin-antitoxin system toxin component, PIN family [Deltaproteobacteria bacterium]
MSRIVIDASVLVSAAFGGTPLDAVARVFHGHDAFISDDVERELIAVAEKLAGKLPSKAAAAVRERFRALLALAHRVRVAEKVHVCRDATDDCYLSLAKAARAHFLITGDRDLLVIPESDLRRHGVPCAIVTPKQFLEMDT